MDTVWRDSQLQRRAWADTAGFWACLRALASEPELVALHGGGRGWSYLAWQGLGRPLRDLADLTLVAGRQSGSCTDAWTRFEGGQFLLFDYEFPVGPWAWSSDAMTEASYGRMFRPTKLLAWSPSGEAFGCGEVDDLAVRCAQAGELAAPRLRRAPRPAWSAAVHAEKVAAVRVAIARGDLYQANLTCPIRAELEADPQADLACFQALQTIAPGGFAVCWRTAGRTVISHSPECFLHLQGGRVLSRPIKGTRPRLPGQDAAARAELRAAAKDNAELAMIVDLVRNDLGRISRPGGVHVVDPAMIVDLPYVHHLVASVAGDCRPGVDLHDLLAAAFPAGSITGAPKIQAMRLIRELEGEPRGPYCGSIGWQGGEAAQLSVAIRTMVIEGEQVRLQAGGGIVADSDGAEEWRELLAKAGPMLRALGADPTRL